jgi:hypothetical protein
MLPSKQFEMLAQRRMSEKFGVALRPGAVPGVHKTFDFVSADRAIVGDAKYYTLVGGVKPPAAKLATITEYVWLLEKTHSPTQFLVFGNDRAVPVMWLKHHGGHLTSVAFYFLDVDGTLESLTPPF